MIYKLFSFLTISLCFINYGCGQTGKQSDIIDIAYIANADHPNPRMRFKVLTSVIKDKKELTKGFLNEIEGFGEQRYSELSPLILEQDIPAIQQAIFDKKLTYKELTLFYIYRIHKFETDINLSLNSIISLNPNAIKEAEKCDAALSGTTDKNSVFGMPILLKDNIGFDLLPTTAGADILAENYTPDAFIVKQLKKNGAVILGKTNLSEWAYYFCSGCPLGYSAIGGQTFNPYNRMQIETGGSSSGSGVAVAANFAVAAVGTETSGSIISPSSLNSLAGLKPTVGLLSRAGIVPISSTLDTPGPMTKNIVDNAILMDAMSGHDPLDNLSHLNISENSYYADINNRSLETVRLGVFKHLLDHSIYANAINTLKDRGAEIIELELQAEPLPGFLTLLNLDMKIDLAHYLSSFASEKIPVKDIEDIISYNNENISVRAPYGQALFEGILKDSTSAHDFKILKENLHKTGKSFLENPMKTHNLDALLSINNFHSGLAAVALFPCLTIPMGYKENDEPQGLTLIAPSHYEKQLLQIAYQIEQVLSARKIPEKYR